MANMGDFIELQAADGHRLAAYRAGPTDAKAGIVVLQEIFGINHHIRAVTDRFAAEGFAVIAPALFDRAERGVELGYQQDDAKRGMAIRAQVPAEGTLLDITAAAEALNTPRKFIVGYCWGGSLAWIAATQTKLFNAASGWYGGLIVQTKDAAPNCPVQLHFGEQDTGIPMADVEAIRAAQPGIELYTYPAGHGFGCDERAAFHAESYRLAQSRTLALFRANG
jgi:carboxymethylenebutenolidase